MASYMQKPVRALAATLLTTLAMGLPFAANAASTNEMVEMCVAAMDKQSIAKAELYRTKMKRIRGGSLKKLTLAVIPLTKEGEKMTVECQIKSGEVIKLTIK